VVYHQLHMVERTQGLILRTRPLTDSSLIVQWLTPDSGRIAAVAKGARRSNSPFRGKLDLFYLADFSFSRSRRSDLHTLREVQLLETHTALREQLAYLQQACYCAALIEQTTETETPLPLIFPLMTDLLNHLPKQPPQPQTIFAFELKLLNELGLKPDLAKSKLTPGAKGIVSTLSATDWPAVSRLKLSEAQVTELSQFLHGFLIFHLGRIPKGRTL
jgi:DNA repair protein RecO (recombination protein O)